MSQPTLKGKLAKALEALRGREEANIVRERGEPISNPFFWPDPELQNVEIELFSLVRGKWELGWIPDEFYLRWALRKLMWEALRAPATVGQIDLAIETFLTRVRVTLSNFKVLVAIDGLNPLDSPLVVEKVTVGVLQDLVDARIAKEALVQSGGTFSTWALVDVNAPSLEHVAYPAIRGVSETLDFLATLDQRSQAFRGHPGEMRVGSLGFVVSEGPPRQFAIKDDWNRGLKYSIDPETAQNKNRLHYKAGPFPWASLPQDSELSKNLREAYRRFGHACRLGEDPEAAIPLAMSAIESLLSDEYEKRLSTAGRLILASLALGAPAIWPLVITGWFERRNEILHEPSQLIWNPDEASRAFWSLYGVLDLISSYIVSQKIKTRDELLTRLLTQANVGAAKKSIKEQYSALETLQKNALTAQYADEIGQQVKTWKAISDRLKPRIA